MHSAAQRWETPKMPEVPKRFVPFHPRTFTIGDFEVIDDSEVEEEAVLSRRRSRPVHC